MAFLEYLSTFDFHDKQSPEQEADDQHILECQYRRGVAGCGECGHYESCDIIKNRLRARVGLLQLDDGLKGDR